MLQIARWLARIAIAFGPWAGASEPMKALRVLTIEDDALIGAPLAELLA